MGAVGPNERVYSVSKLAAIVHALRREGISTAAGLRGTGLAERDLHESATRVSFEQMARVCRNALALSTDPHFAYHTGSRFHLSTYGMYGFAILSSTDFREAIAFALQYYQLAMPLVDTSCREERHRLIWMLSPREALDTTVSRFILELEMAILTALHRDCISPSLVPLEAHLPFSAPRDARVYPDMFACRVLFDQDAARMIFDSKWLDTEPAYGNEIAHQELLILCEQLMEELRLRVGIAGKVREILLMNRMLPMSFSAVAKQLNMTGRTLRRKLGVERTSFRQILADLRIRLAIKYLRDTELSIEDISHKLGFSENASFRHAFHRWTKMAPLKYRDRARKG